VVRDVRVPFVREQSRYDKARVRALFAAWRTDLEVIQALREELRHCFGSASLNLPYLDGLIDAGMRAIADGMIDVASVLPDGVAVTFDEDGPSERYGLGVVGFASPATADDFVANVLHTSGNRRAFEAPL